MPFVRAAGLWREAGRDGWRGGKPGGTEWKLREECKLYGGVAREVKGGRSEWSSRIGEYEMNVEEGKQVEQKDKTKQNSGVEGWRRSGDRWSKGMKWRSGDYGRSKEEKGEGKERKEREEW